jgi:DNA repair exonuclease SbcCD ATPase subunit
LNIGLSVLEEKEKEYNELEKTINELSIKYEFYKKLSDITGSSGISIYILEQKLNELNEMLNDILEEQINKRIILYRKSSGIDIKIQLTSGEEIYTIGGTESLLIDIAIKIIASKLSLMPRPNVLFIDESISVFDINKLESIEDFFVYLKNYFGNIFLITHIQDIKYKVDKIIYLEKKEEKSYINNNNETNLMKTKELKKKMI